jgi:ribosomal protein S18 acetylase RimI-like enzyme
MGAARLALSARGVNRLRPVGAASTEGDRLGESGIAYRLLDGGGAADRDADLMALAGEVYGNAGDPAAVAEARARRARVWRRQPGFALAEARHGGFLVGYASGMPLRPSTSWWRDLTTPLPPEVTAEHPGRTFALTELLVRASWRRQGIGRELHELMLDGRPEERATLTVPPGAGAAQAAFRSWGWRKVARARAEGTAATVVDVLVLSLPWLPPPGRDW